MKLSNRKIKFYFLSFLKHDFKAGISVFFVALPLCLGVSLASNAPIYSGLIAGILGGLIVTLISKSSLSVSGPAAGLTAICAAAISQLGSLELFFIAVAFAGILQIILGLFKLGGFTSFIPSAVIKGMLAAIGIILITKQIPLLLGYDKPNFWTNQLFNVITLNHSFDHLENIYQSLSIGSITIAAISIILLLLWNKFLAKKVAVLPSSFILVAAGVIISALFQQYIPALSLKPTQFVHIPSNVLSSISFPKIEHVIANAAIWKFAVIICFVATLETLLSIEAIDKLDPYNRITPQNRELIAQGSANFLSGMLSGLPITAVIVRSSANAEAGAKTKLAAFTHGIWLLLAILLGATIINLIPYCVLAVLLIRTGYNLAKPKMIIAVYKQGREQFLPFAVTVVAILFTDLLIGVVIGIIYAIYFLIKHTYKAGFNLKESKKGHIQYYNIDLALNVSFLNKKKIAALLDKIPEYSVVTIDGTNSIYIDRDVLEIFQDYKQKAHTKHIELILKSIPSVETIELH